MTNDDDERKKRHERILALATSLAETTEDGADGIHDLMARLTAGNPRLLKAERTTAIQFLAAVAAHMDDQTIAINNFKRLWLLLEEVHDNMKRTIDAQEQTIQILRDR